MAAVCPMAVVFVATTPSHLCLPPTVAHPVVDAKAFSVLGLVPQPDGEREAMLQKAGEPLLLLILAGQLLLLPLNGDNAEIVIEACALRFRDGAASVYRRPFRDAARVYRRDRYR